MSSVQVETIDTDSKEIAMQEASLDIWDKKYRLKTKTGEIVDKTIDDTFKRVARAIADVEQGKANRETWYERFLWALRRGAIPAGRITSNAGAQEHKPATSTINCTVSGTIKDSMDGILDKVHEAGLTLKAGCGIGYEFSTLRPKGAYVSGGGAYTSGPLSFMDIYDKMCFTVSSAGGRRGAQMATFDVGHPDAMDFIRAKREDGRLRQFNCSLLITDEFMDAVKYNLNWPLAFPLPESDADGIDLSDPNEIVWREWPNTEGYVVRDDGLVACKVYKTVPARRMWDMIMSSTYDFAEPGFIMVDRINEMNNNWFCENIRATNPCGEQPLPPYGACLLGSVNLTRFVDNPFTPDARFDWDEYREVVQVFTRLLDNVVEINGLPLGKQRDEIERKRRHGMGFLGLGSTLTMLGMKYGSPESIEFTERVARDMALAGWEQALELAREKGPAPLMEEEFEVTGDMLRRRPEMEADGYRVGDRVSGRVLWARYSRYMQRVAEQAPELVDALEVLAGHQHGAVRVGAPQLRPVALRVPQVELEAVVQQRIGLSPEAAGAHVGLDARQRGAHQAQIGAVLDDQEGGVGGLAAEALGVHPAELLHDAHEELDVVLVQVEARGQVTEDGILENQQQDGGHRADSGHEPPRGPIEELGGDQDPTHDEDEYLDELDVALDRPASRQR